MRPEIEWEKHPSYGTAGFMRRSGSRGRLFGSSIRNHMNIVALYIREADRCHDLHEDRIMGHKTLIEVEFSAAQFAELLTTMNVGSGVPCTIRQIAGVGSIPDPPDEEVEIDRVQDSFKQSAKKLMQYMKKQQDDITQLFGSKQALNKNDRQWVINVIARIRQEVESNLPFILDQFNEATERVVTAAKAEVDAFITNVIAQTGLSQLRSMQLDTKKLTEADNENQR